MRENEFSQYWDFSPWVEGHPSKVSLGIKGLVLNPPTGRLQPIFILALHKGGFLGHFSTSAAQQFGITETWKLVLMPNYICTFRLCIEFGHFQKNLFTIFSHILFSKFWNSVTMFSEFAEKVSVLFGIYKPFGTQWPNHFFRQISKPIMFLSKNKMKIWLTLPFVENEGQTKACCGLWG